MKLPLILCLIVFSTKSFCQDSEVNKNAFSLPIDSLTNKVSFYGVEAVDKSADEIYNVVKEWFNTNATKFSKSTSLKSSETNDVIWGTSKKNMSDIDLKFKIDDNLSMDDNANKKSIGKATLKYFGSSYGCVRTIYVTYDIKVSCKDKRFKYEITNFNVEHYNPYTAKKMAFMQTKDDGPCRSTGSIENLLNCKSCTKGLNDFFQVIQREIDLLKTDLITCTKKPISGSSW